MSKTKVNPAMEGGVSRAIDFNLKKEDLMLLILEGRKENMEEQIAAIQTVSTELRKELAEAQNKFKKKITKLCMATLNPEARKLAKAFTLSDDEKVMVEEDGNGNDEDTDSQFKLNLSTYSDGYVYTKFRSAPVGEAKGGTYIKQQHEETITMYLYSRMSLSLSLSLHGRVFLKKDDIIRNKEIRACGEYSRDFAIADESLDIDFQKTLSEYKKMAEVAKNLGDNESLLSDVLSEYDLFNRNQPRAKAKMIKEVLSRDESGQALLENIMTAASGVKLLGNVSK